MPAPVVLLGGLTGTAKTEILNRLPDHGCQVIDLEGLANHRGSLFGWRGGQPSQKAFETALAERIVRLSTNAPVVIEAESSKVGDVIIPPSVWKAMRAGRRIQIKAPLAERAAFTVRAYEDIIADGERLERIIDKLRPYQPRERIERWHNLARTGAFADLSAELMEYHYDPKYGVPTGPGVHAWVTLDDLSSEGLAEAASRLSDMVRTVSSVGGDR